MVLQIDWKGKRMGSLDALTWEIVWQGNERMVSLCSVRNCGKLIDRGKSTLTGKRKRQGRQGDMEQEKEAEGKVKFTDRGIGMGSLEALYMGIGWVSWTTDHCWKVALLGWLRCPTVHQCPTGARIQYRASAPLQQQLCPHPVVCPSELDSGQPKKAKCIPKKVSGRKFSSVHQCPMVSSRNAVQLSQDPISNSRCCRTPTANISSQLIPTYANLCQQHVNQRQNIEKSRNWTDNTI